jgi:hypothetical protein
MNQNQINAQIAKGNQAFQQQLTGGLMGAAAQIPFMAEGGMVDDDQSHHYWHDIAKQFTEGMEPEKETPAFQAGKSMGEALGKGLKAIPMASGGRIPAMLSPGEKYLPPTEVQKVATGKKPVEQAGKMIPGKAKVDGDSLKNDTVHARLEEGGIVIPRSVMQSKNPGEQSRKFVEAVLARQAMKRK